MPSDVTQSSSDDETKKQYEIKLSSPSNHSFFIQPQCSIIGVRLCTSSLLYHKRLLLTTIAQTKTLPTPKENAGNLLTVMAIFSEILLKKPFQ